MTAPKRPREMSREELTTEIAILSIQLRNGVISFTDSIRLSTLRRALRKLQKGVGK